MGRYWVVWKVLLAGLGLKAREGLRTSPGLGARGAGEMGMLQEGQVWWEGDQKLFGS